MSTDEASRTQQIRAILEEKEQGINLREYVFYTGKGTRNGIFRTLVKQSAAAGAGFPAPELELSPELLRDLADHPGGFLDLDVALREPTFAATAPELWRLTGRVGSAAGGPVDAPDGSGPRWRYLLPITVGSTVCGGLLILFAYSKERARARSSWLNAEDMRSISVAWMPRLWARSAHCLVT